MTRLLVFTLTILLAVLASNTMSIENQKRKFQSFNLGKLNDVLNDKNSQKNILNGINLIKDISNIFKKPIANPKEATNIPTTPNPMFPDYTNEQFIKDIVEINVKFLINRIGLGETEKAMITNKLPEMINSKTPEELFKVLEPFFLGAIGTYFNDPSLMFAPNPYAEACRLVLQMYFASPEAPEFLKDTATQQQIYKYYNNLVTLNDLDKITNKITMDVFTYMNTAGAMEIKPIIAQLLPELYPLVQNENNVENIYTIAQSYIVTKVAFYYQSLMNIFQNPNMP